jgi:predicted DNA-binding protein (MmcQ/YjbR family)
MLIVYFRLYSFVNVCNRIILRFQAKFKDLLMVTPKEVKTFSLAFEEAEELPHFEKQSFRVKKKIFATLDTKLNRAVLKLTAVDQSVFSSDKNKAIYPVDNAWGKQGWTIVELKKVRKDVFKDALTSSYCNVAPKKLAEKYQPKI